MQHIFANAYGDICAFQMENSHTSDERRFFDENRNASGVLVIQFVVQDERKHAEVRSDLCV